MTINEVKAEVEAIKPEIAPENEAFKANFEKISKQERHNAEIRKQLEEKRKEFEKDREALDRYRKFDEQLQKDPLSVLEKLGLPLDRIQQLANERNQPGDPSARQALEIAKKLEAELAAEKEKAKQERLSKEEIKLNASIADTIKTEGYDLIEQLGAENAVKEFMEQYYEETGEIVDIKVACNAITDDLVAKITKVKDSKWLKPKEVVQENKPEQVKTLSNKMVQTSAPEKRLMTDDDRLKAAALIMQRGR